jgi:hypothetical protein
MHQQMTISLDWKALVEIQSGSTPSTTHGPCSQPSVAFYINFDFIISFLKEFRRTFP